MKDGFVDRKDPALRPQLLAELPWGREQGFILVNAWVRALLILARGSLGGSVRGAGEPGAG